MTTETPCSNLRIKSPFLRKNQHEVKLQTILSEAARLFNIQHSDDGPLIGYRSLPSLSIERRSEILSLTQKTSGQLGAFINEGIADGSIRDVDHWIIENAIAGTVDAAPDIATRMRFSDNSEVSAEYLELFFNGISNRS